ncbi:MAG TPA: beta-ketoacyl synthase N-terminal-like domain-containing protein [Terriglobales bacterium]|nr:beta-ketoacyl synthase N-terminal-like domain-containing protein [Terriglobales bacterium]
MSAQAERRRVAVTGLGALSPAGAGVGAYREWQQTRGQRPSGERVPEFRPADYVRSPKLLRSMHRTFQLVAAAAVLAMRHAGLPTADSLAGAGLAAERAGIATALADISPLTTDLLQVLAEVTSNQTGDQTKQFTWAQFAEVSLHKLHPFRRLTLLANMAAAHTSLLFGLQGPSFTFTSGAGSGGQTLTQAYWTITHNRADLMLCQTADSPEQSFSAQPASELAGALVVESWESATARRAPILAELLAPHSNSAGEEYFSLRQPADGSPVCGLMAALLRVDDLKGTATPALALTDLLGIASAAA